MNIFAWFVNATLLDSKWWGLRIDLTQPTKIFWSMYFTIKRWWFRFSWPSKMTLISSAVRTCLVISFMRWTELFWVPSIKCVTYGVTTVPKHSFILENFCKSTSKHNKYSNPNAMMKMGSMSMRIKEKALNYRFGAPLVESCFIMTPWTGQYVKGAGNISVICAEFVKAQIILSNKITPLFKYWK